MSFYAGEAELQVKRRILLTIQDMTRKLLDASRLLLGMYESILGGDQQGAESNRAELAKAIADVEGYRRSLTRQLSEVGAMLLNREEILRTAFMLEEMASYIDSLSFRIYMGSSYLMGAGDLKGRLRDLLSQVLNAAAKLNDLSRMLQVNPGKIGDLASLVEREEKSMDGLYRETLVESLAKLKDFKQLIVLMDVLERAERVVDLALDVSEMLIIISLEM